MLTIWISLLFSLSTTCWFSLQADKHTKPSVLGRCDANEVKPEHGLAVNGSFYISLHPCELFRHLTWQDILMYSWILPNILWYILRYFQICLPPKTKTRCGTNSTDVFVSDLKCNKLQKLEYALVYHATQIVCRNFCFWTDLMFLMCRISSISSIFRHF